MLGMLTASSLAFVVPNAFNGLVADVAEYFRALLTGDHVRRPSLPVDLTAVRTLYYSLDVNIRMLTHPHVLLNHRQRYFKWQERTRFIEALRLLLVMLLSLCRIVARPAEVLVALRALDMSAATLHFRNPNSTLWIRAELGALLHVDAVQLFLDHLVVLVEFHHVLLVFNKQVNPVRHAPLERMDMFLTVKAEVVLAMLASA